MVLGGGVILHTGRISTFVAVHHWLLAAPPRWLQYALPLLPDYSSSHTQHAAHCTHLVSARIKHHLTSTEGPYPFPKIQCDMQLGPYIQWGKKVFSQPPIVQVLPLKKMREACNFHHRYTSTMRDKIRKKNPENHIVGFLKNLFANYGGK